MFQTFKNAWKTPELRAKLLFTLLIVVLFRLGSNIPVPWISAEALSLFEAYSGGSILQFMNILSGGAFGQATLFALGVSPYITASIVMQLLTIAIPALEKMSKNGEEGRKKISAITRIVTIVLALITSYGYAMMIITQYGMATFSKDSEGWIFKMAVMIACYCAGAAIVMWIAERINEHGIGNGISIILFVNIVSSAPRYLAQLYSLVYDGKSFKPLGILWIVLILAIVLAVVGFIVWFTNSERRIKVQYAKRVVGRKMYGGQSSNLPLKLNMSGVMPIIFANSIVAIPATIASFMQNTSWKNFANAMTDYFSPTKPVYILLFIILLVAFSYFYILISFNPVEVSNNIRNQGGAIPGIRPGRPTVEFIQKVLNRVTFIGAIFLVFISGLPMVINAILTAFNITAFSSVAFMGSSVLIVVGVALETERELEAQLTLRNYKGFLD